MRNLFFLSVFSILAPTTLLWGLTSLQKSSFTPASARFVSAEPRPRVAGVGIFGAVPAPSGQITTQLKVGDARELILKSYLEQHQSPLASLSAQMVKAADRYRLDFRLLAAIARQESALCKIIPPDSYNCWGWGIHQRGTLEFSSFQEGIDTVAAGLRKRYLDQGLTTPAQIMAKYTPSSPGTWAQAVNQFIQEME